MGSNRNKRVFATLRQCINEDSDKLVLINDAIAPVLAIPYMETKNIGWFCCIMHTTSKHSAFRWIHSHGFFLSITLLPPGLMPWSCSQRACIDTTNIHCLYVREYCKWSIRLYVVPVGWMLLSAKLSKGAFNIKYISLESPSPITFLYLPIGVLFVFEYDEDSIWCSFEFFLETVIKVQLVLAFFWFETIQTKVRLLAIRWYSTWLLSPYVSTVANNV